MALQPDTLSSLIVNNLRNKSMTLKDADGNDVQVTISGDDPGTKILADAIAHAVVQHIIAALDIEVPPISFVTLVTGQAVGTSNPGPVKCLVN